MPSVPQLFDQALEHHQAGQLHQAEMLYRQILQIDPRHARTLHLLGMLAHQAGRPDLAIDYIRQALRINPAFPEAHNDLGNALKQQGLLDEAIAHYQQALRFKPDHFVTHNNLGMVYQQQGKLDAAIFHYRELVRLRPDLAEGYNNLGNAQRDAGRVDEAIANLRQSLQRKPDFPEAHSNLANALRDQGKLDEAVASYRQALRLRPDYAAAHANLGNALGDKGDFAEAIASFRQALRLQPDHVEAHSNLGIALQEIGHLDEAIASFQQALRLQPDHFEAILNLGKARQEQNRLDDALACYNHALRLKPDFVDARCHAGTVLQQLGDFAGAESALRQVLSAQPRHAESLLHLATLLRGRLPAADRAVLEQCLKEPDLTDLERSFLLFGLATVCDALGEYQEAAAYLREANALDVVNFRRKGHVYNVAEHTRFIDNIIAAFTPAFFERVRGFGLETARPVFIVGLPRSGTTLTEQILAAHSQVFGAGELALGQADFQALGGQTTDAASFAVLPRLQADVIRGVAQRHLDQLRSVNSTAERVVDKMPDNYQYLGLLTALFPRAKFIHCRRDLRDVAVSCWMTHFRHVHWANDPDHIAARFRDYDRLMRHWRAVLPVPFLDIDYEETVSDLEGVARRLLDWCGLEWEPSCLDFHKSKRPIVTASSIQARQPIYTRSVARWRHYEQELGGLFAALPPNRDV